MKYPFVKQSGIKDCGASCLLMIMKYYGGRASLEYIRDLTNTTKDGVNSYMLLEAAKKLGFATKGVNGNVFDLEDKDLPCIAHVIIDNSYQHFIVIYKLDRKRKELLIADPAQSKVIKMKYKDFEKIASNNFLLLYPIKKIPIIDTEFNLKKVIYKFISNNKKFFSMIILVSFIITFIGIIFSFQFQFLMDNVISYSNSNLFMYIILFISLVIINIIFKMIRELILNFINHSLSKELLINVYDRVLSLPYLYYKNRSTGEVISRIQDIDTIKNFTSKIFVTCFVDSFLAIFSIIVLWSINSTLTKIILLFSMILFIVLLIFWKVLYTKLKTIKDKNIAVNNYLVETISGIETIKGFGLKEFIENKFVRKYNDYLKESFKTNKIFIYFESIKSFIEENMIVIILSYSVALINNNCLTIGLLMSYYLLLSFYLEPIRNLFSIGLNYKDVKVSLEKINELYDYRIESNSKLLKQDKIKGNISIKNLKYCYTPKNNLLKNINFEIKDKDRVLIYGKSGSGKSTIAKILAKSLSNFDGKILLDNRDLNEYDPNYLLNRLCYISQNEILFQGSIYENIYLNSDRKYDDFLDICSLCKVDEIIEKNPLKYNMLLEENGFNISGGERQRILLARALLKDADIYIFDESLNEIDIEREKEILTSVFKKYKDKTFIIISHRYHNNHLFNKKIEIKHGTSYEN